MQFQSLNIIEPILKSLEEEGYTIPTPIQEKGIPVVLQGRDLLGSAQTGTGKTAAFAIPILQLLDKNRSADKKRNIRIWLRGVPEPFWGCPESVFHAFL